MKPERKVAIAVLIGAAAYLLMTDPDLIQEILQVVKIERNPKPDRPDTNSGTQL